MSSANLIGTSVSSSSDLGRRGRASRQSQVRVAIMKLDEEISHLKERYRAASSVEECSLLDSEIRHRENEKLNFERQLRKLVLNQTRQQRHRQKKKMKIEQCIPILTHTRVKDEAQSVDQVSQTPLFDIHHLSDISPGSLEEISELDSQEHSFPGFYHAKLSPSPIPHEGFPSSSPLWPYSEGSMISPNSDNSLIFPGPDQSESLDSTHINLDPSLSIGQEVFAEGVFQNLLYHVDSDDLSTQLSHTSSVFDIGGLTEPFQRTEKENLSLLGIIPACVPDQHHFYDCLERIVMFQVLHRMEWMNLSNVVRARKSFADDTAKYGHISAQLFCLAEGLLKRPLTDDEKFAFKNFNFDILLKEGSAFD